jgi:hypothetical protein
MNLVELYEVRKTIKTSKFRVNRSSADTSKQQDIAL